MYIEADKVCTRRLTSIHHSFHIPSVKPHHSLVCSSPKSRARVCVGSRVGVDVEKYAWHAPSVKAGASNTAGGRNCAAAADLQVQALHVELGAVVVLTSVESDNLVADDIVTRCELSGNRGRDLETVADESVGDPGTGARADNRRLRYLGPLQRAGSEGGTVT